MRYVAKQRQMLKKFKDTGIQNYVNEVYISKWFLKVLLRIKFFFNVKNNFKMTKINSTSNANLFL